MQDPNDPLLRGVFIGCLARTHQWVELQTWREKWGEPKSVELKFYYAEVDFERGRAETALRLIGDVVQKRGEARDFALRGQIYWRKGQKDEALWDFDRALKKDPSLLSPAIVSGEHYLSEGLPDKALGIVNRSLVARGQIWGDLEKSKLLTLRSKILTKLGHVDDARRDIEEAKRLMNSGLENGTGLGAKPKAKSSALPDIRVPEIVLPPLKPVEKKAGASSPKGS